MAHHIIIGKMKEAVVTERPELGHKLTVYLNCYHSPKVADYIFMEHLATSLKSMAARLEEKAAAARKRDEETIVEGDFVG